ncbi:MAG: gliding motility-associated C-terminal domain-containing protein [Thermaurantimonas sp.]
MELIFSQENVARPEYYILRDEGQFSNGQKRSEPTYFVRGNGAVLAITARQWTWYYLSDTIQHQRGISHMTFRNANPSAKVEDEGNNEYFERYYTIYEDGRPVYSVKKLIVCGLYPGIDLEMTAGEAGLRYEFIVQQGADLSKIQMEFSSDLQVSVNEDGIYLARSSHIAITDETPYIVMPGGDKLPCRFKKTGNVVSLSLGRSKNLLALASEPLRIDPQVVWSTYYRGPLNDFITAVSIDSARNVLAAGRTSSTVDIVSPGAHQTTYGGGFSDAYLVKFDRCGRRLWATYYGGLFNDNAFAVATDPSNHIYLAGTTNSPTGISTTGSHQPSLGGGTDGFLVKFDENGLRMWGTYYGGINAESNVDVAVNFNGTQIILAGTTLSNNNIATAGSFKPTISNLTASDGFFAAFTDTGVRLFGSYFGGTLADEINAVQFDASGNFYIAGQTNSTADIASPGSFSSTLSGNSDGFYAKFTTTGQRVYSSYYGGPALDEIRSIFVRNNLLYLGGITQSTSGIATPGSFKPTLAAGINGFIAQFDTNGTTRNWATYYGGVNTRIFSLAADLSGNVFFGGHTSDQNLATPGSFSTTLSGINDLIVGRFTSAGALTWASYYGGPAIEQQIASVVFGFNNTIYLGGTCQGVHTTLGIFGYYGNSSGINSGILGRFFATPLHVEIRALSKTSLCPNEAFVVSFVGGGLGAPTTVVAELSDAAFSFVTPTAIGQLGNYSGGAATITCNVPPALNAGNYLIRIRIQNPAYNSVHFCDTVSVLTNGTVTLQQTKDTLCPGDSDTLQLINYSQGAISWFQNGNQIQGANQSTLTVTQAGQYFALIQHNGCAIYTDTVNYFETNTSAITWSPFTPVCQNDPPFALTNASPAGGTYSGPGVSNNAFNPALAGPGKHPIQYTLQLTSFCQLTSFDTIEVYPTYNQTLTGSICTGQTITLPDGQQVDQPGTYTVLLISTDGCDSTLIFIITGLPPTGKLLPNDTNLCEGQTLVLNPGFFQSYQWNTGETTPTITVSERGLYTVTVQDALGCIHTDSILITTDCFPYLFVPNAFSPNDDRRNDRFKVAVSEFITYFEIMIFNRWGELVFHAFSADFEWDGMFRGQKLPQGSYPYRIIYEYEISGQRFRKEETGSIHIVK